MSLNVDKFWDGPHVWALSGDVERLQRFLTQHPTEWTLWMATGHACTTQQLEGKPTAWQCCWRQAPESMQRTITV